MPDLVAQDHPLGSIYAKIEQAEKHTSVFVNESKTFLASYPIKFAHIEDLNTGIYSVTVADIKPVPLKLSVIIGDVIHNLRSALDLLACQLVKLETSNHDCHKIFFPITDRAENYLKILKKRWSRNPALAIFERLQPYDGGNDHDLWILHRLNIQDKHRLLIVAPTTIGSWESEALFVPGSSKPGEERQFDGRARIRQGDIFIPKIGDKLVGVDPSYFSEGAEGEIFVHFRFHGDIAFNEPEIIRSKSAYESLQKLCISVRHAVYQYNSLYH